MPYNVDPLLALLLQRVQSGGQQYAPSQLTQPIDSMDQTAGFGPIEDLPEVYQQNYYRNQMEAAGIPSQQAEQLSLAQVVDNRSKKLAQQQLEQEAAFKEQQLYQNQQQIGLQRQELGLKKQELAQGAKYQQDVLGQRTKELEQQKYLGLLSRFQDVPDELAFQAIKEVQDTGDFSSETTAAIRQYKSDEKLQQLRLAVIKDFKEGGLGGQSLGQQLSTVEQAYITSQKPTKTTPPEQLSPTQTAQRRVESLQIQAQKEEKAGMHPIDALAKTVGKIPYWMSPLPMSANPNAPMFEHLPVVRPQKVDQWVSKLQQDKLAGATPDQINLALRNATGHDITNAEAIEILNKLTGQ